MLRNMRNYNDQKNIIKEKFILQDFLNHIK